MVTWFSCVLALSGCPAEEAQLLAALKVECVPSGQSAPQGAWLCPEPQTLECDLSDAGQPHTVYVSEGETLSCQDASLRVVSDGNLTLGRHQVRVVDAAGVAVCTSELTVEDTVAPVLEAKTIALWPPNHKLHSIAPEDCVAIHDACGGPLRAEFIWASSDEPVDAIGDGNHSPDIVLDDCRHLSLRSERQGPEDGRVYKVGVRVIDQAGNATEAACNVLVAHDQSGKARGEGETLSAARKDVAVTSGEAYRIRFDGSDGSAACGQGDGGTGAGTPGDGDVGAPDSDPEPQSQSPQ